MWGDSKIRTVFAAWGACLGLSVLFWLLGSTNGDDLKLNLYTVSAGVFFSVAMLPLLVLPILFWLKRPDVTALAELKRRIEATRAEQERKRANWRRRRATVVRVTDLGARENDSIKVRCELEISSEDLRSAPYRATLEEFVPPLGAARLVPGATLPVVVNPSNETELLVVWEER